MSSTDQLISGLGDKIRMLETENSLLRNVITTKESTIASMSRELDLHKFCIMELSKVSGEEQSEYVRVRGLLVKAYGMIRDIEKNVSAARVEGDARVAVVEAAHANDVALLKGDIARRGILIATLTEEVRICKAAMAQGPVTYDEAVLAYGLDRAMTDVGKLETLLDDACEKVSAACTKLTRVCSLDVERMKNLHYYDRMEHAEGKCHKLKAKLDMLVVQKDPEELFRFGLCALSPGAVLKRTPAVTTVADGTVDVVRMRRRINELEEQLAKRADQPKKRKPDAAFPSPYPFVAAMTNPRPV